jgi:excisionase family DNA binding protein
MSGTQTIEQVRIERAGGNGQIAPALLSMPKTCEYLSISRPTLYKLAASGKLGPMPISLCRKVLYRRAELDEWIAAGCPPRRAWASMKGKNF